MKNIYKLLMLALPITLALWSCDQVSEPYKQTGTFKPNEGKVVKRVLLEDYTGMKCGNCPEAHDIADSIKKQFPKNVVLLEVHAGPFAATSLKHTYNFEIPEGKEWDTFFGNSKKGNPNGLIDRQGYPEKQQVLRPTVWRERVQSALSDTTPAIVSLEAAALYSEASGKVSAIISYNFTKEMAKYPYLSVCLAEDSIVYYQEDYRLRPASTEVEDYVHNNVLRACMNGTWGEQLFSKQDVKIYNFTIPAYYGWRPKKMRVIAFVHDFGNSYKVYQAVEASLY